MRFLSLVLGILAAFAIAHGGTPTVTYEHAAQATPVTAVCSTDADCAAYDRSRGVTSDGRP